MLIAALLVGGRVPATADQPVADWTFLVYMAADNNLEAAGLENLAQMALVGSSANVNVVVQVSRQADTPNDGDIVDLPSFETTKRLRVERDHLDVRADLGMPEMSDPATLTDFVRWGAAAYPARRYALGLWDHGAAWLGCCEDERSSGFMPLAGIGRALRDGGVVFDLLGFDACLMANLETALALRSHARFIAASEELEDGVGWDYTAVLAALRREPSMDGAGLERTIADTFLAGLRSESRAAAQYGTFSVTDNGKLPAVAEAFRAFTVAVDGYGQADGRVDPLARLGRLGQVVGHARGVAPALGRSSFDDEGQTVDLAVFAESAAEISGSPDIRRAASGLRRALREAVPYTVAGDGYAGTPLGGLSVSVPVGRGKRESRLFQRYADEVPEMAQLGRTDLLRRYRAVANAEANPPAVSPPALDAREMAAGRTRATLTASATDEALVASVEVLVVGQVEGRNVVLAVDKQPAAFRPTVSVRHTFDGTGW